MLDLIELSHLSDKKSILLSGGEQQRLSLARALAGEPKLLLLDEPFVHLDGRLRLKISNYLLQMKKNRGTSFILVSHDGEEMLSLADKIFHFSEGKVKRIGTPKDFFYNPISKEEGELFGVINQVEREGKLMLFRPTEFELTEDTNGINLTYMSSQFAGAHYINYFETTNKERIILFQNQPMTNETKINIKKRD